MNELESRNDLITLTADIASAYLAENTLPASEVAGLISAIHGALAALGETAAEVAPKPEPAVSIRSSIKHDYIVCLEDGAKLKMLKRYLRTNYDMSPEDYRLRWNLPRDYPMVAPAYAEQRRTLAHQIGLGRKKADAPAAAPKATKANAVPAKRGRPRKVAAPETVEA